MQLNETFFVTRAKDTMKYEVVDTDAEKDEVISFITNNFELGPLVIANIYRNRLQIETFFKWIKGNLTIKALWGYSENAVKTHLWVAISSYLLLAWMKSHRGVNPFQS